LVALFALCFLGMAITVRWYYVRQRSAVEAAAVRELSAVVAEGKIQIANWRRERLGDGRFLASSPAMQAAKRLLSGSATSADGATVLSMMAALKREFGYDDISLVGSGGDAHVRLESETRDEGRLRKPQRARLAAQAAAHNDVLLSDINQENRAGVRLMTLTVPLASSGALILEIDPSSFLYPYLKSWPGGSRTGETILARRESDELIYLSELRYVNHGASPSRRSLRGVPIPSDAMLDSGVVFRTRDYRNVPVLAEVRRIPDSPWLLIAKIDSAEVDAPIGRLAREMSLLLALIAIANGAGVALIWKSRQLRMQHESEERFRSIANDTPAFLWMVSADGGSVFVNKRLSEFFGVEERHSVDLWKGYLHPDDAGRAIAEILSCFTARMVYSGEFRLRRSDGAYRWVAARGVPRTSPQGEFLGYAGALLDITDRKAAEQKLSTANGVLAEALEEKTQREAEIRALSARLIKAQEEERTRISRELHDDLSQQIAALSIGMGNLKRSLPEQQQEPRNQSDRIQQRLVGLSEAIRRISHELHPAILEHAGLAAALRGYCEEFEALTSIRVTVQTAGEFAGLRPGVALTVYRIAQEALGNVAKHAKVDAASIELTRANGEVSLVVSDRGIGMPADRRGRSAGLGLVSIRERTRLVDGTLDLDTAPDCGTTLRVRIPDASETQRVAGAAG
jgi:PAS domain S-box-containing protein